MWSIRMECVVRWEAWLIKLAVWLVQVMLNAEPVDQWVSVAMRGVKTSTSLLIILKNPPQLKHHVLRSQFGNILAHCG